MSLISVLKRCRELTKASQDSDWAAMSVSEILVVLDRGISATESGKELNHDELTLLFGPTGSLQETSIVNGWGDEFLSLSTKFDDLIM